MAQEAPTIPEKTKRSPFVLVGVFILLCVIIALAGWVFSLTGIGCPLKAATGIPCPGCGMTRAWQDALQLNFAGALARHPLFWFMPLVLAFAFFLPAVNKKVFAAVMTGAVILILAVWIIRLI